MNIKLEPHKLFKYFLTTITILIVSGYSYLYFIAQSQYGEKYLPLLITGRSLILALFLIYFYNPLRSKFEYGPSMPFFAFSAGISLILLQKKYDLLNMAHFLLYGKVLPPDPSLAACAAAEIVPGFELSIPGFTTKK